MHEVTLAQQMIQTIVDVAEKNGARRVLSALLDLGTLTHVEPETLTFAFEAVAQETLAEGCELVIHRVPLTAACRDCTWRGEVEPSHPACPRCDAVGLTVITGRELQLVSIDVEDAKET